MRVMQALVALGPVDARNVGRDPLLRWIILYPLLMALILRLAIGPVTTWLMARFGFDLLPYYPLLMSFVLLMPPMLVGMVIGFLLLDQHDDHTLWALRVTPLTLTGYLGFRMAVPLVLSVGITMVALPLAGLVDLPASANFVAAISAAPIAPFYALMLAALADNKVQGFAITKALGVLTLPPCIAWFVAPPLQWVFGIDPLYWPARLYWSLAAGEGQAGAYLLFGLAYQSLLVALLLRRFSRRFQA